MTNPGALIGDILSFARHCGQTDRDPEEVAKRRGWLDEEGLPTEAGRQLVEELQNQTGARSVFSGTA